jgi:anti-sigma factor RsiW
VNCPDLRERLSPLLEGRLGPSERAAAAEHLLACRPCRALRDELRELLDDLHRLGAVQSEPEGLADRVLARVPAPRPRRRGPSARALAWRRAAAWAVVFLGAWWQLVGTQLGDLAADEAAGVVAEAREATLRGRASLLPVPPDELPDVSSSVDRAGASLAAFGRTLHRALFVPEPRDASPPETVPPQGEP